MQIIYQHFIVKTKMQRIGDHAIHPAHAKIISAHHEDMHAAQHNAVGRGLPEQIHRDRQDHQHQITAENHHRSRQIGNRAGAQSEQKGMKDILQILADVRHRNDDAEPLPQCDDIHADNETTFPEPVVELIFDARFLITLLQPVSHELNHQHAGKP